MHSILSIHLTANGAERETANVATKSSATLVNRLLLQTSNIDVTAALLLWAHICKHKTGAPIAMQESASINRQSAWVLMMGL